MTQLTVREKNTREKDMWRQRKCVHCFGMKVKSVANPKKAKFDVIYSISIIHGYDRVWNLHYTSELCIHSAESS